MDVTLIYLGTDFRATPLRVLAELENQATQIESELFVNLSSLGSGMVVLATCNRFELYLTTETPSLARRFLAQAVEKFCNLDQVEIENLFTAKEGIDVVKHLFEVTSGLKSMVIGETEIAGQVRSALANASTRTQLPSELGQLFGSALRLSKSLGSNTELRAVSRSVISSALQLVEGKLQELPNLKVLLIGTGSFARVVSKTLSNRGGCDVAVYSRSGRAGVFSERYGYRAVESGQLLDELTQSDLVISVSGGPGFVIDKAMASSVARARGESRPLMILDLALSKDVDPAVADVEGIAVKDLESVKFDMVSDDLGVISRAEQLLDEAVVEYETDALIREVDPLIVALRSKIDSWVELETEQIRKREGEELAQVVQKSLRKVTRAIMHEPSVRGKELARVGKQSEYAEAISMLFDLKVAESE